MIGEIMMKALVLAGGFPQIALINELKSRGITVVLADYNVEPVAKKYADKYYQISTLDVDAIRSVAVAENVDFLLTVCTDQALHTVAKVSEELGLPCYIDYETALNVTNKQYMKKMFVKHNIPTAKFKILDKYDKREQIDLEYPLIIKPVDCNSSKGVRKCFNEEELKRYLSDAINYSRTNTAIVEEYIDGVELSVDAYVENGIAHVLCISKSEKISENDKFVIFRAIWPSPISPIIVKRIEGIAQKIADSFKITNSPLLIQTLTDGENIYVVEFSARTGGGVKYILIKQTSGFDVIKAVVDLTLGEFPHVGKLIKEQNYLINDFIYCKAGKYDHFEGFDELKANKIIKDYYIFKWKGAEFESIKSSGDRIAGYTVIADSVEELIEKHTIARKKFKIISDRGIDIARHDLLTPIIYTDGFICSINEERK